MTSKNSHKNPLAMEDNFSPGIKWSPLLLCGSQTHKIWHNSAKLQAPEDYYLAALNANNVAIVRNMDPNYINYFQNLVDGGRVINLFNIESKNYLIESTLENEWAMDAIKGAISEHTKILPFLITPLEQELSKKLDIPFYGSRRINESFGTKSGIRKLAARHSIPMPPGYICTTVREIEHALDALQKHFKFAAIKHDTSVSGFLSKKISTKTKHPIASLLHKLLKRPFKPNKDIFIVEGWMSAQVSVGAHIEILPNKKYYICAAWQQIIDSDGVSYIGAGPLHISTHAFASLKKELNTLARALVNAGAIGSFGPDFLITSSEDKCLEPDTACIIELNARIPYTAFPLEIVKNVKGVIGSGFFSTHIHMQKKYNFVEVATILRNARLLITKKNSKAIGVVPFGISMLPWKSFTIIAMADNWESARHIAQKTQALFQ